MSYRTEAIITFPLTALGERAYGGGRGKRMKECTWYLTLLASKRLKQAQYFDNNRGI